MLKHEAMDGACSTTLPLELWRTGLGTGDIDPILPPAPNVIDNR
jgi:hypothetical protein